MTPTSPPTALSQLGWSPFFAEGLAALGDQGLRPARICIEHNHLYRVRAGDDEDEEGRLAQASGSLKHAAANQAALPGVGDWVALGASVSDPETIHAVLPRRSYFSRQASGNVTAEQVVAANIDTVFLVSGLDRDFNRRRIERYLVAAADSGARPVIVLNKADLCEDLAEPLAIIQDVAQRTHGTGEVPVHAVSCHDQKGLDALRVYLAVGQTVALLGSSGVGKSSIINQLLGRERQRTRNVRSHDQRGRHTTVHRELMVHPDGGVIIDTPGMRELRLWDRRPVDVAFDDIESLADGCRFRDCHHRTEPGCAVQAAVTGGQISPTRLSHYHQLQEERDGQAARQDELAAAAERQRLRRVHRVHRRVTKR